MTQDREELKRRLTEALKDDWTWYAHGEFVLMSGGGIAPDVIAKVANDDRRAYIAAANPQTVLSLLSDLEAMQEESGRLRAALRWIASQKSTMHDEIEAWELQDYARQAIPKEPEA